MGLFFWPPCLLFILKNNIRQLSPEALKNTKSRSGVISRIVVGGQKSNHQNLKHTSSLYLQSIQSGNSCFTNEMKMFTFLCQSHIYDTLFCRLLIITGVILLVGSTRLLRFITSRQKRSNMEKNYGPRRSTTSRVREPSPNSAVIQASTLNHLLSSSSKEKA